MTCALHQKSASPSAITLEAGYRVDRGLLSQELHTTHRGVT